MRFRLGFSAALMIACCALGAEPKDQVDADEQLLAELVEQEKSLTQERLDELLRTAARYAANRSLVWLLKKGANPDQVDRNGVTTLIDAVNAMTEGENLRYLPTREEKPTREERQRLLKEVQTIELLSKAARQVDARDAEGRTATLVAAQMNRFDIVSVLLAAGADINASDHFGMTAIFYAPSNRLAALVKAGADVRATNREGQSLVHYAMANRCNRSLKDFIAAAIAVGAKDTQDAKGRWASELPDPALCPIFDFGPNGLRDHLSIIQTVRETLKATR